MSKILITGATGMIGSTLVRSALEHGDQVVALSRNAESAREQLGDNVLTHAWPAPTQAPPPAEALAGVDTVIHLLGEPVDQRWNAKVKESIRDSRVLSTRMLVKALADLPAGERPATLVCGSATGYYGPRSDGPVDESAGPGSNFLADVVVAWEHEAHAAPEGVRVVCARTGVVLASSGGALAKMLPFFKSGVGGPVAGGRQFVPWIHLDDVVGALHFCAHQSGARGPVNLTAPHPVDNRALSKALGKVLGRPAVLPVPAFGVKALYGEMAEIVTDGVEAVPAALERLGYQFQHPAIEEALSAALGPR